MRYLTLFFILLLSCCAPKNYPGEKTNKYDKFLEQFNSDLIKIGHQPIDFSLLTIREVPDLNDNGTPKSGMCYELGVKTSGPANIGINTFVQNNPYYVQGLVIYHELGHCYFGKGHVPGRQIMSDSPIPIVLLSGDFISEGSRLELLRQMINQ